MSSTKSPRVGDPAPDFSLVSTSGEVVRLSDLLGRPVVLFFYPKDDTPGCTAEACSFRDHHQAFLDAGAQVLGISSDSPESHRRFASRHQLPFPLLSDSDGSVRRAYDVPRTFGLIPGRVTYVLDRSGIIRHIFDSQFRPQKHIDEALQTLQSLKT